MKLVAPFVLLAGLAANAVGQSKLTVSVPDHTQCASTVITWENGVELVSTAFDSAWIEKDGAAAPVIVAGSLETTSHPFVNDAAAGFTVSIQLNDNNNDIAQLQYTIEPSSYRYPGP
ncbi:hypothetical protein GSI_08480 [Ganoderma sinense ZZ0214-1]|uniref:Uncharacterized protein n=1 Tax=Ganoderma sinense ZZ0214-1 TaxID=1077348 RepID=A0A2G8S3U6_9APHY|nr:hypothetical protein GSI_08480 [Ganoderma sinense ZZ0214-1]